MENVLPNAELGIYDINPVCVIEEGAISWDVLSLQIIVLTSSIFHQCLDSSEARKGDLFPGLNQSRRFAGAGIPMCFQDRTLLSLLSFESFSMIELMENATTWLATVVCQSKVDLCNIQVSFYSPLLALTNCM